MSRLARPLLLGALLAASVGLGCDDEEVLARADAYLTVDPLEIDFQDVAIGTTSTIEVEVRNPGAAVLLLEAALDAAIDGEVTLAEVPEQLTAGTRQTVKVSFTPTSAGLREGTLTFTTDSDMTAEVTVTVRGRGVEPALVADPPTIDFGRVLVGDTVTTTVTLTNTADRAIEVIRATLTPATSLEYGVTLDRIRLEPGATTQMSVRYAPTDVGADEGMLTILDSGPRAMDLAVRLRGQGVESDIVVEPSALGFQNVVAGTPQTLPFFIRNIGTEPHTVTGLAFASSGASTATELALDPGATPIQIGGGESVQVDVTWSPAVAGMLFDEVRVDATGRRDTAVVSLSGVAAAAPVPRIEVAPASLAFGQVEVGMSATDNLQITNVGNADLTLTGAIEIQPANAPYTLVNAPTPGTTFAPTDTTTFQVTFDPTAAGVAAAADIVIRSDDPNAPEVRVPLTGEGVVTAVPNIFVDPNPLAFGQVPRGTRASRTVLVRNDGTANLVLNLVRLTDDAGGRFTLPSPPIPGAILIPGQTQTFSVEYFDNGMVMAYAGMLQIQSNDPAQGIVQVPLTAATEPPPAAMTDINVTLTWSSTNADVDLHFIRPGGSFFDAPTDCCFCNTNPDWGMPMNATDNPFLDRDDLTGPGPETVNLSVAETGEYQVVAHFYDDNNAGPVDVTVTVRLRGTVVAMRTQQLSDGERWVAGRINWNSTSMMGTFTPSIFPPFPTIFRLCF